MSGGSNAAERSERASGNAQGRKKIVYRFCKAADRSDLAEETVREGQVEISRNLPQIIFLDSVGGEMERKERSEATSEANTTPAPLGAME